MIISLYRWTGTGLVGPFLLMLMTVGSPAVGQTAGVDTVDHPNRQPYTTNRSVLYHVLAAPAYALHGLTRPLGWGLRYVEQNYPQVFDAKLPPRGGIPLAELGGPAGIAGGLLLYDNQLFGSEHRAQVRALYGSSEVFRVQGQYRMPAPVGERSTLQVNVNFFSDPKSEFFVGGNDSRNSADETVFFRRQLDVTTGLSWASADGGVSGGGSLLYEHVAAEEGRGERGRQLAERAPPGLRTVDLLTPRLWALVGTPRGGRRPFLGTEVLVQLDYTHDLNSRRFRYGRYVAEVRQYLPVGLFPTTRRLALRARLEQVAPLLDGAEVPFYQQPGLGGQSSLRGYVFNRLQDEGALLLSAEYRYPIWMNLDAVVFTDAGQVFDALPDVRGDRFRWNYGGGIHLLNEDGLSFRFEVAVGTEGARTILTVQPSFRRTGR